jgi:hypothetical protein
VFPQIFDKIIIKRLSALLLEFSTVDAQQHGFLMQLKPPANSVVQLDELLCVPSDTQFFGPRCGFHSRLGPSPLQNVRWKLLGMKRKTLGIV